MADQVQVTKLNQYAGIGPTVDSVSVPKLVMYVALYPGEGASSNAQGHVHTQIITRRS